MEDNIKKLKDALKENCYGLALGASFPEVLLEIDDIDNASDEEVIELARRRGIL